MAQVRLAEDMFDRGRNSTAVAELIGTCPSTLRSHFSRNGIGRKIVTRGSNGPYGPRDGVAYRRTQARKLGIG